jgi:hypothetical protein
MNWQIRGFLWYVAGMGRPSVPVIEVTAPDGTTSLWAAYSIPYKKAVEAVTQKIPPDHAAELSVRRLPPGMKFNDKRPGDVFKIELPPRCPSCKGILRLARTLLVSRTEEAIRLFKCQCGQRIWE